MSTLTIAQSHSRAHAGSEELQVLQNFNKLSVVSFVATTLSLGFFLLASTGLFDFSSRSTMFFAVCMPAIILASSYFSMKQIKVTQEKGQGLTMISLASVALYVVSIAAVTICLAVMYFVFA